MQKTATQNSATGQLSSEQMKAQLASYLEAQAENMRSFHNVMKILEGISAGLMIIVFVAALTLSIMWKSIPVEAIPAAWMLLPVSAGILMMLIGVHTLVLRAYPPSSFLAVLQNRSTIRGLTKSRGFLTGKAVEFPAWSLILGGLVAGVFFAVFAWATWTVNWGLLVPMINILGVAMGIVIAVSILFNIYQKVIKPR